MDDTAHLPTDQRIARLRRFFSLRRRGDNALDACRPSGAEWASTRWTDTEWSDTVRDTAIELVVASHGRTD